MRAFMKRVGLWCFRELDKENIALIVGTAILTRGAYLWWPPGAWIVCGCIILLVWGMLCLAAFKSYGRHDGNNQE